MKSRLFIEGVWKYVMSGVGCPDDILRRYRSMTRLEEA